MPTHRQADQAVRGVFEYDAPLPGSRSFTVAASDRVLMRVDVAADLATDEFIENLWVYLDGQDPDRPPLRIA